MAADFKIKYPATNADSAAVTITLASLATSTSLLSGQQSAAVSNTTDLDLDKPVTGVITVGSTVTANTKIEVWATMPIKIVSGTATWGDTVTGSDATIAITSDGIKFALLRRIVTIAVDSTTANRTYPFNGATLAEVFGDYVPPSISFQVFHNTGSNLHATAGNHYIHVHRKQEQSV
jgi:hypothetical protein